MQQLAADLARETELAADAVAAVEQLEREHTTLTAAQESEQQAQREAAAALAEAAAAVAALEAEHTRLTEHAAANEARRAALLRQEREAGERQAKLRQRLEEIALQRRTLEAAAIDAAVTAEAAESLAQAAGDVEQSRAAAEAAEAALREAQAIETAARERWQASEARRAKLRTEMQALTELLAGVADKRWPPALDSVRVEPGFEAALGAALGDDLTAPIDAAAPMHWRTLAPYGYGLALPGGAVPLSSHVAAPAALTRRLAHIGVVADAATAERLQGDLVPGQRLVTRDGGLWRWDGFRRAPGTPSAAGQRLRQRNRLTELEEELRGADREHAARGDELAGTQGVARQAGEAERMRRQAMRDAVGALARAQERDARLRQEVAATASRLAGLAESAERLTLDIAETEAQERSAREGLATLPDPALARDELAALRARLAERRTVQLAAQGEHDRLLREGASRAQRLAGVAVEMQSWRARAEAAARQRATIETRRAELVPEITRLARRPAEIAEQRERLAEAIASAAERRGLAADELASGETRLADAERARKAADAALGAAREDRVRCQSLREQAEQASNALSHRIAERLNCAADAILASAGVDAGEALPAIAEAEARLERLTRERDGMGPVNLVAESEASEIEERLNGLTREREDLTAAIARLRQGIAALNREGRERLLAAFATVNEHFGRLFVRLFGGGRAHLSLDQGEDEAGLEIMASPPGKRLQSLSLLSGGEQALTALALLFAVFLTNPAPICVLDEVDAPLDDANVDRFCHLVEEIAETAETRFLIITHHLLTMARMDRLFGVTMGERGISQLVSVDLQRAQELRRTA